MDGGGIERMFNPNWLVRGEYLYEDFGSCNVPLGSLKSRKLEK